MAELLVITLRNKLLTLLILAVLAAPLVAATEVSITLAGRNASETNLNKTCYGCNNSINVVSWNTSLTKTWMVNSKNNSLDTLSFNISNVTAFQVQQLTVNGTVVNAYQAGANGMLNFTYVTNNSNKTYVLAPAQNMNGYNMTWAWLWNMNGNTSLRTQNSPTGCAANTVYQNTNKTPLFVSYSTSDGGGAAFKIGFVTDGLNPPSRRTARFNTSTGDVTQGGVFSIVLPGNYWIINVDAADTEECTTWS